MANDLRGPLPVKVDATSNGEFRPVPLAEPVARANAEAERRIGAHARRVGLDRRAFLQSLCGAATTFLTLNEAFAALGNTGGHVPRTPGGRIRARGGGRDDRRRRVHLRRVQTHMVDPAGAGAAPPAGTGSASSPASRTGPAAPTTRSTAFLPISSSSTCSWTATPTLRCSRSCRNRRRTTRCRSRRPNRVRVLVDRMAGAPRLFLHAMVVPNAGPDIAPLQLMKDAVDRYPIAAWKCYTQGAERPRLCARQSRHVGIPFIERARELGSPQHLHP